MKGDRKDNLKIHINGITCTYYKCFLYLESNDYMSNPKNICDSNLLAPFPVL